MLLGALAVGPSVVLSGVWQTDKLGKSVLGGVGQHPR